MTSATEQATATRHSNNGYCDGRDPSWVCDACVAVDGEQADETAERFARLDAVLHPASDALLLAQRGLIDRLYASAGEPAPAMVPLHPSHEWGPERCWACDCRPYGKWSGLPCDGA